MTPLVNTFVPDFLIFFSWKNTGQNVVVSAADGTK